MRKLIVAAVMALSLASPVFAAVGEIGSIGGANYVVIGVTKIGPGEFKVTVASDAHGIQTFFIQET